MARIDLNRIRDGVWYQGRRVSCGGILRWDGKGREGKGEHSPGLN
jgi:hypothetical protein